MLQLRRYVLSNCRDPFELDDKIHMFLMTIKHGLHGQNSNLTTETILFVNIYQNRTCYTDNILVFHNTHFWQLWQIFKRISTPPCRFFVLIIWQCTHNLASTRNVTNSYLGSIPVTNELHQVSKGSKSHLISGGDSSCSWVLVRALGLLSGRGVAGYNAGWGGEMMEEPDGSSIFAVDVERVPPMRHLVWEEYKHSA